MCGWSSCIVCISVIDQAWDLLRSYIDTRGKDGEVGGVRGGVKDSPSQLVSCVVEKILSLNHDVPQWLIMKLKVNTYHYYYYY